jgi:hypothetical protein
VCVHAVHHTSFGGFFSFMLFAVVSQYLTAAANVSTCSTWVYNYPLQPQVGIVVTIISTLCVVGYYCPAGLAGPGAAQPCAASELCTTCINESFLLNAWCVWAWEDLHFSPCACDQYACIHSCALGPSHNNITGTLIASGIARCCTCTPSTLVGT